MAGRSRRPGSTDGRLSHAAGPADHRRARPSARAPARHADTILPSLVAVGATAAAAARSVVHALDVAAVRVRRRARDHGLWRPRDVSGRVGQPHDLAAVSARRVLRGEFFLDRAGLHQRRAWLPHPGGQAAADATRDHADAADSDRDAGLQRVDGADLRRARRHPRVRGGHGAGRALRLLRAVRHHQSGCLGRGGARFPGAARKAGARLPALLPAQTEEPSPQGRQHRRFRHPLGRPLRAHDRARRRQPDDRLLHRAPDRGDGGRSRRGDHPVAAPHHQPQFFVRAAAAVRGAHLRPGDRDRSGPMVGPQRQLLGP